MRHPPFVASADKTIGDTCTHIGAQRLAARIRDAWARCGHDVPVEVLPVYPGNPTSTWTVRMPTLIGGLPARTP